MNSVNLIGRLTADPETGQYEKNGKPTMVTSFRLAPRRRRGHRFRSGHDLNVLAATCADIIRKGHLVGVTGRLNHSEWNTPDNERRSRLEVIASQGDFLARPRADGHGSETI